MQNLKIPDFYEKLRKYKFLPFVKKAEKFYKLNEQTKDLSYEQLSNITVDTLVINGGVRDVVAIEEATYISDAIPKSTLIIYKNDNHTSYTRKKYFYEDVKNFFEC